MSQFSMSLDGTKTRTNYGIDLQSAIQALATLSSGATAPSTTYAYQLWYDTTNNILKIRNSANTNWLNLHSELGTRWYNTVPHVVAKRTGVSGVSVNTPTTMSSFTEIQDTGSNFNASTGTFTAPTTGEYMFTLTLNGTITGGTSSNPFAVIRYQVNGGTAVNFGVVNCPGTSISVTGFYTLALTAGDTLNFTYSAGCTVGSGTPLFGGDYRLYIQGIES